MSLSFYVRIMSEWLPPGPKPQLLHVQGGQDKMSLQSVSVSRHRAEVYYPVVQVQGTCILHSQHTEQQGQQKR